MGPSRDVLDLVQIASPCSAAWEEMPGDDRVRFCGDCSLNVYNLSAMTRKEANELVLQREGRLCVCFYQRQDGTVLTDNCPVGFRAARQRLRLLVAGVASMVTAALGLLGRPIEWPESRTQGMLMLRPTGELPPTNKSVGKVAAEPEVEKRLVPGGMVLGDYAGPRKKPARRSRGSLGGKRLELPRPR